MIEAIPIAFANSPPGICLVVAGTNIEAVCPLFVAQFLLLFSMREVTDRKASEGIHFNMEKCGMRIKSKLQKSNPIATYLNVTKKAAWDA